MSSASRAMDLVKELGDSCRFYKVGSQLFTAAGPSIVESLRTAGAEVFLDLKFHDIPNTVSGAVRSAAALGVRLMTVHASGGVRMMLAGVDAAGDPERCGILAVTVLTSLDHEALADSWGRSGEIDIADEVLRLAGLSHAAGVHGIVCSGQEASRVREKFGHSLALLVPGVRLAGTDRQDQARVVTPRAAAAAGARYIVLGRAVSAAADPRAAMQRVLLEIQGNTRDAVD